MSEKKGSWRKYMPHPKDKDDFEDSRSGKIIFKWILVFKEVYREV